MHRYTEKLPGICRERGGPSCFSTPLGVGWHSLIRRFLRDMARTTVNLIGNCLASAVMARWEGELNLTGTAPAIDPAAPEA